MTSSPHDRARARRRVLLQRQLLVLARRDAVRRTCPDDMTPVSRDEVPAEELADLDARAHGSPPSDGGEPQS